MNSIFEIIRQSASRWPDKEILKELPMDETGERAITYSELITRAEGIAALLRTKGCQPKSRVLLLFNSNIEFTVAFLGCIFGGVIAVPMYLTKSASFVEELKAFSADCLTNLLLTTSEMQPMLQARLPGYSIYTTDGRLEEAEYIPVDLSPASEAFILYTSGSTGRPKGVVHTHQSFSSHVMSVQDRLRLQDTDSSVCVSPLQHIMGMLNVFISLTFGLQVIFLPMLRVLQSPLDWVRELSRRRATIFLGPDFVYKLAAGAYTLEQAEGLDLSHLRISLSGSERILPSTVDSFTRTFARHGFAANSLIIGYGMTEAGIISISALNEPPKMLESLPGIYNCGQVVAGYQAVIVDSNSGRECGSGEIGEIWVKGSGLADRYWNDPDQTKKDFSMNLPEGEGPFFRTGDLACKIDGNLFLTGRLKEIIIIKGQNFYPDDIEAGVRRQAMTIGQCAAFSVEDIEGERLIVVVETALHDKEELSRLADLTVADIQARNGIRIAELLYVPPQSLPLTRTGKLQRSKCKALYLEKKLSLAYVYEHLTNKTGTGKSRSAFTSDWMKELTLNELREAVLADLITAFKRLLPGESESIDIGLPIHLLGTDSITAIELHHLVEEKYGVQLPISYYLEGNTIESIAGRIIEESRASTAMEASPMMEELDRDSMDIETIYNRLNSYSEEELDLILDALQR
ncbi:AMP-binding protein [Paenibacillus tianjinensis]|uniref:Non-ribosomal peptide synthetase n=1 Tax=Paenibacillus tianjinensis TaxID=2810347 RepID=A0ABX7L856_9BACL|nr:AMP-binding protein [Paenibacillus tianjinensis]QSF44182.1 non-ribosomal peptide synthetase [Paenibacillus tianjinensis]